MTGEYFILIQQHKEVWHPLYMRNVSNCNWFTDIVTMSLLNKCGYQIMALYHKGSFFLEVIGPVLLHLIGQLVIVFTALPRLTVIWGLVFNGC